MESSVDNLMGLKGIPHFWTFGEQTNLDNFVNVGTGKGKAGFKTALNLAEVVRLAPLHFTNHRVDILLRSHDDPGSAAANLFRVPR